MDNGWSAYSRPFDGSYAEKENSSTINVQTTVSVDGVALDVYGTVTYDKWIVPDDVSLSNFTVDETYFMLIMSLRLDLL